MRSPPRRLARSDRWLGSSEEQRRGAGKVLLPLMRVILSRHPPNCTLPKALREKLKTLETRAARYEAAQLVATQLAGEHLAWAMTAERQVEAVLVTTITTMTRQSNSHFTTGLCPSRPPRPVPTVPRRPVVEPRGLGVASAAPATLEVAECTAERTAGQRKPCGANKQRSRD